MEALRREILCPHCKRPLRFWNEPVRADDCCCPARKIPSIMMTRNEIDKLVYGSGHGFALEHRLWQEDHFEISNCRLIETPGFVPPGCIEIRWSGAGGEHALVIPGNRADDFMERYRSAPDPEAKEHVMIHEIRKAVSV